MLLLQYLVIFLEGDFLPRNCAFKEELNWTFLRESLVNMLLRSKKILYKSLIKDCLSPIHVLSQEAMFEDFNYHKSSSIESSQEINTYVTLALPEAKKSTCATLKKFFLMVMELDSSRSSADMQGLTARADGTDIFCIIVDNLIIPEIYSDYIQTHLAPVAILSCQTLKNIFSNTEECFMLYQLYFVKNVFVLSTRVGSLLSLVLYVLVSYVLYYL